MNSVKYCFQLLLIFTNFVQFELWENKRLSCVGEKSWMEMVADVVDVERFEDICNNGNGELKLGR
jgi:hypothetical protein